MRTTIAAWTIIFWIKKLYKHILLGGKEALLASAVLYALGYLSISFFPYDFVTSFQELQNKLADGSDAFFISSSCGGFIICSTRLLVEIFITLPLGIFLAVLLRGHSHRRTAVMLIGFILGVKHRKFWPSSKPRFFKKALDEP